MGVRVVSGWGGRPGRGVRIHGVRLAGTRLHVSFVGRPPVEGGPADPAWRGYRAEVSETADVVELAVREQLPDADLPPGQDLRHGGYYYLLPVELVRPLAGRPVVDRFTGSPVPVVRRVLTAGPTVRWLLQYEQSGGHAWTQGFTGPGGVFQLTQGPAQLGVLSEPAFFERTGITTVRGVCGEWGSGPGETSLHWVEDGDGVQLMSADLPLDALVEIANALVTAE